MFVGYMMANVILQLEFAQYSAAPIPTAQPGANNKGQTFMFCDECGDEFTPNKANQRFCSRDCSRFWHIHYDPSGENEATRTERETLIETNLRHLDDLRRAGHTAWPTIKMKPTKRSQPT